MYSHLMDLVIFHYHLQPGGVTTVIRQGVQALRAHSSRVSRIRVVAGRVPAGFPVGREAEVLCAPDIDYLSPALLPRMLWKQRVERLTGMLLERFGGSNAVWWVHNYHLGKNPVFTDAVLKAAGLPDGPRLILQPHDFPEAGRSANLALLDRLVTRPLYPVGQRVRYALINQRDLDLLQGAGMPADLLFLLENPVSPLPGAVAHGDGKPALRSRLFPASDARQPTLLYPVRCIRRKNVLEAGLLLRLTDVPLRLIVTLPGVSRTERGYSRMVRDAFREGLIPGEFATGVLRKDLSLEQLAAACDAVASSSVQEGFGYLFIQALQWGLPLIARRLETVPGREGMYDGYPASFYDNLLCPLESGERQAVLRRYHAKLGRLGKTAPAGILEKLESTLRDSFSRDAVDFSLLDPSRQLRLLAAAGEDSDFRSAMRKLNTGLADRLQKCLSERPSDRARDVDRLFGFAAYASRFDRLLESFDRPAERGAPSDPRRVQAGMRTAFLDASHLRLLLD
jgi:hypothetical protein